MLQHSDGTVTHRVRAVVAALSANAVYEGFNIVIDFLLAPVLLQLWGFTGALMYAAGTFLLDILTVVYYGRYKKDIFGYEGVKSFLSTIEHKIRTLFHLSGTIPWVLRVALVSTLSVWWINPFQAVIWTRQANDFSGLDPRDWFVFLCSFSVGTMLWLLTIAGVLEMLKQIF